MNDKKLDLDMAHEYFCVICEVRHDGAKCPQCGRISSNLASETFMKEIVVPVKYKVYYRKGNREATLAKIDPAQHVIGWTEDHGDYRIQALGVDHGGK